MYISAYTYIYKYIGRERKTSIKIGPLNSCGPQAARIQRFDFDFQARRRADICQYFKITVSSTKQVQNRAHAKNLRPTDSK